MKNKKQLGIYIHIPFCVQKCVYCDFLSAPMDSKTKEKYVSALIDEIKRSALPEEKADKYCVKTIFFGGGTPSILTGDQISNILGAVRESFDVDEYAEITIECNPGTLDDEKTFAYRECKINRISIGLQSAVDAELAMLGRIHDLKAFEMSFNMARKYGFNNINIDIMSAIPGQTYESFERTLKSVVAYKPEHISAYSLIVEEGTSLSRNLDKYPELPDEETERKMYHLAEKLLGRAGYERYEISNYSKSGYECQHNLSYWDRKDYLGFGIGAASLFEEKRYSNCRDIKAYIEADGNIQLIRENIEILNLTDRIEEFMFLGLRKTAGVDERLFKKTFGRNMEEVYSEVLHKNLENGLLEKHGHNYCLSSYGLDISNTVMADFML
ncbi:MAG: radical SAM family heme chaperone HemW [Eubacteriales bacterium]|nr:radical SAM family heme chaperone HemW [Eubacteriales bacterium]